MAKGGRKYARDNRGRFASVGATARGGRLRTAGGSNRATVTVKAKGGGKGTISKPKGLKPGAIKPKPSAGSAPKVSLDQAAWKRRTQRLQSKGYGILRQSSGEGIKKAERSVRTQLNAERFLGNMLHGSKSGAEFNQKFLSRPRHGTGSTSIGVAASNRRYDAERKATRAAKAAARKAASAKPTVKGPSVIKGKPVPGTVKLPRIKSDTPGGKVLKGLMRGLPTVPTGRKPDYVDPKTRIQATNLNFEQPRRLSGRQVAALNQTLKSQGWSTRSNGLGSVVTHSKSFSGRGGTSEIAQIRISGKGGPLVSRMAEVTRSVSSRPGRGSGGSLIEGRFGLRRKPRLNSKPRRRSAT